MNLPQGEQMGFIAQDIEKVFPQLVLILLVALSTKLLEIGYQLKGGDAENFKQLKFTVGFSDIPETIHFFHDQKYTSENVALKESILVQAQNETETIKVFDRGITARNTYDEFTENNIQFVSRLNNKARYETLKADNDLKSDLCTSTLKIISDNWCYLYNSNKQKTKHPIR